GARVAIETIGDEQHDGALPEHAARPQLVEIVYRMADAGASRPVLDRLGDAVQCDIDIAKPQVARDVGEPGAKDKGVDAVAVVGDRVHKVEKDAAVAAHR